MADEFELTRTISDSDKLGSAAASSNDIADECLQLLVPPLPPVPITTLTTRENLSRWTPFLRHQHTAGALVCQDGR